VERIKLTTEEKDEQLQYQTGIDWWKSISDNTKYIGTENINNRACYVIEMQTEPGFPYTKMWVDKKVYSL